MSAIVEDLLSTMLFSSNPKAHPQPSTSGVEINEAESLEMKDRTLTTNKEPATPSTASVSNTRAHRVRANIQFTSLCYSLFLAGWNDGTTGPLLPRIQQVYHVR